MKRTFIKAGLMIAFAFLAFISTHAQTQRQIAITFDDLIFVPNDNVEQVKTLTAKLLQTLKQHKVPVIGFVNEGKINRPPETEARTKILQMWIDAGFELGNHTYSHLDMFSATPEKFEEDLVAGEQITKRLFAAKGKQANAKSYFRHPYLNTGPTLEKKIAFDQIIAKHNYIVAPVTVDNSDYMFAAVYADAMKKNDRALMQRVAEAYVPYMNSVLEFYEKQSRTLLGYEIKQILLVHANPLNADHFGEVIAMMKRRGYKFISLSEALTDKAYQTYDGYTGRSGTSWLQRWAMTQKHQLTIQQFKEEPDVPEFIKEAYKNRQ
ncbi:MAG TPA: polysaccharide deacetylase family protein [Blastocatellia bacterium]|nr:polysaccharide deacetylase family protein [Blastocatellia bacterium]